MKEISKYALDDPPADDSAFPREGLCIQTEDRRYELLPPPSELDSWVSSLQLAIFGQEVRANTEPSPAPSPKTPRPRRKPYLPPHPPVP